jgi:hypothetical protein
MPLGDAEKNKRGIRNIFKEEAILLAQIGRKYL